MARLEILKFPEKRETAALMVLYRTAHNRKIYELSIRAVLRASGIDFVVFVLNGPPDDTEVFLKRTIEEVKPEKGVFIVKSKNNLGFGRANNLGYEVIRMFSAKYIVLINDDFIIHPTIIQHLKNIVEKYGYAGASAIVINPDASLQVYANYLCHDRSREGGIRNLISRRPSVPTYLCGCFSIYRIKDLEECGGLFNKPQFMYAEDSELGVRLWRCGKKLVVVPLIAGVHVGSCTTSSGKILDRLKFRLALHRAGGCVHAKRYPPSSIQVFIYPLLYLLEMIFSIFPPLASNLFMRFIGYVECERTTLRIPREPRTLDLECLLPVSLKRLLR